MTIYDMVRETIENRTQWQNGETVTIWGEDSATKIVIYTSKELLFLQHYIADGKTPVRNVVTVQCGHLSLCEAGAAWTFTLSEQDYRAWQKRIEKSLKEANAKPVTVRSGRLDSFSLSPEAMMRHKAAGGIQV